jgi:hypothetical protein
MKLRSTYNDPFGIFSKFILSEEGDEGGEGGGGSGGGDDGDDDDPKPKGKGAVNVEDVVKGRLRQQEQALLKKLGVDSIDAAQAALKKAREAEDALLSETERLKKEADEAKAQSDKDKAEAAVERHNARVERALLKELAKLELDDEVEAKRLARLTRLIDLEVGAEATEVAEAVKTLKDEWPELFGASMGSAEEDKGKGKNGKGKESDPKGGPKGKGQPSKTAMEAGAERARKLVKERSQYDFEVKTG